VKVGVRPEKLRPVPPGAGGPEGENEVAGRVRTSTYLGLGHQLEIEGPAGTTLTVYVQNAGEGTPAAGDEVRLRWRPEHTFVV
jgi:ABC-type Fe3+/spermidine/putrescine transport system ATPase subunit